MYSYMQKYIWKKKKKGELNLNERILFFMKLYSKLENANELFRKTVDAQ